MAIMLIIGILFFACGLLVMAKGVFSFFRQRRTISGAHKAIGVVTHLTTRAAQSGHIYCPLVQFQTPRHGLVNFQSEFGTSPASHRVGQQVEVLYNPLNPSEAQIGGFMSLWLTPLIYLFLGLIFLGLGFVLSVSGALVLLS